MRNLLLTTTILMTAALTTVACEEPAPVPEASPSVEAKAIASPPPPKVAEVPESFITHKSADPNRMPNDSIHASLGQPKAPRPLPAGHPPLAGHQHASGSARPASPGMVPRGGAVEKGVALPLPLKGPGSVAELEGRLKRLPTGADGEAARKSLEELYRISFTIDRRKRDHARAATLADELAANPAAAPAAERIKGFLAVSKRFDTKTARVHYEKAIELEPTFGEAHYALAFLCALNDRETGAKHYKSAAEAGVEDTMSLDRLYGANAAAQQPGH